MKNYILKLTKQESQEIFTLLKNKDDSINNTKNFDFIYNSRKIFESFPERLKKRIYDYKSQGHPYILIKGFSLIQEKDLTPTKRTTYCQAHLYYQNLISTIISNVGFMYKFEEVVSCNMHFKNGNIINKKRSSSFCSGYVQVIGKNSTQVKKRMKNILNRFTLKTLNSLEYNSSLLQGI